MKRLSFNGFNGSPWTGAPFAPQNWIEAAGRAGFDHYSPDVMTLSAWKDSGGTVVQIADMIAEYGMSCEILVAAAMLDHSNIVLDRLKQAADDAKVLGARILQVNMGVPELSAQSEALGKACDAVAGSGLLLGVEFMPFSPLMTLADTLAIIDNVGHERAGAVVDIWHYAHDPGARAALANANLTAIAYFEFDDALPPLSDDLATETMDRRIFPGEGILDCAGFAADVVACGYDGLISVEVLNAQWRNRPAEFACRTYEATRRFF